MEQKIKSALGRDETVIFKDDYAEGNIVEIDDGYAIYMDFVKETETEICLADYNENYFIFEGIL